MSKKDFLINIIGLYSSRITRLLVSIFINAYIVRYLGPTDLGSFRYVQDLMSIFIPFVIFGQEEILARKVLTEKDIDLEISMTIAVQLFHALICMIIVTSYAYVVKAKEFELICWFSTLLIFYALQAPGIYLVSLLKTKKVTMSLLVSFFGAAILKLVVVFFDFGILPLLFAVVFEYFLLALFYFVFYRREGLSFHFDISAFSLKQFYRDAFKPFVISFLFTLEVSLPFIQLRNHMSQDEYSYLSLANSLLMMSVFFPSAISVSYFPQLVNESQNLQDSGAKLFRLLLSFALFVTLGVNYFSADIIRLLYGNAFLAAAPFLRLFMWCSFFYYLQNGLFRILILRRTYDKYLIFLSAYLILFSALIQFYRPTTYEFLYLKIVLSVLHVVLYILWDDFMSGLFFKVFKWNKL